MSLVCWGKKEGNNVCLIQIFSIYFHIYKSVVQYEVPPNFCALLQTFLSSHLCHRQFLLSNNVPISNKLLRCNVVTLIYI